MTSPGVTDAKMNQDVPATPVGFLVHFLNQLKMESAEMSIPESMRTLISQSLELASGLLNYPIAMSSEISQDAKLLAKKTSELDYEGLYAEGTTGKYKFLKEMSSDILQVNLLKMLVRMTGARRILEIGTFTGFAALNMAEALPSDGKLVTLEVLPFFAQFARDFFADTIHANKIDVRLGAALDTLKVAGERKEQFDLIFIDAEKSEYKDYLSIVLDLNILASGATILFDNTLFMGSTYMKNFPEPRYAERGPAVHDFNYILMNEPRVKQVMVPIRDGLTIVRRVGE